MSIVQTIEIITPDIAREYLSKNVKNRNRKDAKIATFARDMAEGRWQVTGESIKFDYDGNLIDGQNRCHAIIKAEVPIESAVTRNIDPSAQGVMDAGTPRSGADTLTLLGGYTNSKNLQAALNAHRAYTGGIVRRANMSLTGSQRLSNSEVLVYAAEHPGMVEASRDAARHRTGGLRIPIGPLSVAVYEFGRLDTDAAEEFFTRITSLSFRGQEDDALRALKRRVDADLAAGRAHYKLGTGLYLLFRTWNAWRSRERISKLQIGGADKGWAEIPVPR